MDADVAPHPKTRGGQGEMCRGWDDDLLAVRVTLLFLLLFPISHGIVLLLALVAAATGLVSTRVARSSLLWFGLAALAGWRVLAAWPMSDNHAYLLVYWCLALGLSRLAASPEAALAASARWLVALVFAFAALWKLVLSDDYVTGTLFRVLLLADQRFACVTDAFGGADPAALDAARDALLPSLVGSATAGELIASTGIGRLADALTWGGALLELTIAVLFFAPLPPRPERLRHVGLIGFCVVTYALAPVAGFGWLLLAMGLSQCPPAARGLRGAYGAAFVILLAEDVLLAAKP